MNAKTENKNFKSKAYILYFVKFSVKSYIPEVLTGYTRDCLTELVTNGKRFKRGHTMCPRSNLLCEMGNYFWTYSIKHRNMFIIQSKLEKPQKNNGIF